jgi:polyvinyl alcohol dehydrogenase (cytochrome)
MQSRHGLASTLWVCIAVASWSCAARSQDSGETVYLEHCSGCHDVAASRAPSKDVLHQMAANRILRTLDFGVMMSVGYRLDRGQREAVSGYLGVVGEDRGPAPSAYCDDRTVHVPNPSRWDWNGWSPASTNTRLQSAPGFGAAEVASLTLKWAFAFEGDVNAFAPPAVLGEQMFVGSAGGSIFALHAKSGCVQWHFQADGPVRTAMVVAPLAAGGRSADGVAVAGLGTGAGSAGGAGSATAHVLFFGDQSGGFYAVGAESGSIKISSAM